MHLQHSGYNVRGHKMYSKLISKHPDLQILHHADVSFFQISLILKIKKIEQKFNNLQDVIYGWWYISKYTTADWKFPVSRLKDLAVVYNFNYLKESMRNSLSASITSSETGCGSSDGPGSGISTRSVFPDSSVTCASCLPSSWDTDSSLYTTFIFI